MFANIEMYKDRLLAILDHIKKHPESYDQTVMHSECGTKHCIAGHAELMFWDESQLTGLPIYSSRLRAKYLLNLNEMQANYLFHHGRTLEEIEEYIFFGGTMWGKRMDIRRAAVVQALEERYKEKINGHTS